MNMEHTVYDFSEPEEAKAAQDAAIIATQNDRFRQTWGADFTIGGQIVITQALAAEGLEWITAIMSAVQQFSDFNEDNDPYGDHGFAAIDVTLGSKTKKVFFKIDLYDLAYEYGSENRTDLAQTRRVMTVMLPSDY